VGKLNTKAQLAGLVTVRKQKPGPALANGTENQGTAADTGNSSRGDGVAWAGPSERALAAPKWCLALSSEPECSRVKPLAWDRWGP